MKAGMPSCDCRLPPQHRWDVCSSGIPQNSENLTSALVMQYVTTY